MHETGRKCACELGEMSQRWRAAGCACGKGTPCTSGVLAGALTEHLDVCPGNRNAWRVLSQLLSTMPAVNTHSLSPQRYHGRTPAAPKQQIPVTSTLP
eukprot:6299330-Pyramimonas_sp.AAC.1